VQLNLSVIWQTTRAPCTLSFTCCLIDDLGDPQEYLFNGHRTNTTGAVEIKSDTGMLCWM
jgi:hypothetical protein